MSKRPNETQRHYLELCQELIEHAQLMRNFAMKPADTWLAKDELAKIGGLISRFEELLEQLSQPQD